MQAQPMPNQQPMMHQMPPPNQYNAGPMMPPPPQVVNGMPMAPPVYANPTGASFVSQAPGETNPCFEPGCFDRDREPHCLALFFLAPLVACQYDGCCCGFLFHLIPSPIFQALVALLCYKPQVVHFDRYVKNGENPSCDVGMFDRTREPACCTKCLFPI